MLLLIGWCCLALFVVVFSFVCVVFFVVRCGLFSVVMFASWPLLVVVRSCVSLRFVVCCSCCLLVFVVVR